MNSIVIGAFVQSYGRHVLKTSASMTSLKLKRPIYFAPYTLSIPATRGIILAKYMIERFHGAYVNGANMFRFLKG